MAHQSDDGNSDFMESYEPTPPAWYLLKEHIPESELPEIRGILGGALIDLCTDAYSEMEMWVQIWKDVCRKQEGGAKPPRALLADSPVVKDLLSAEIRLLLLSLREKAAKEGRDEEAIMSCYRPSVVSYAMSSRQRNRAQSAGGRSAPQEAPSRPQSAQSLQEVRSGSRLSASSDCEERIDAVKHKLNLKDIHKVVAHLKSVLTEDLEAMKREIQYLQECVELRHQSHCDSLAQEPTVSELKEERKQIQRDLGLEEVVHRPLPARWSSVDSGLQEDRRTGPMCCSSTGVSARSPPLIFSLKDKPPRLPATTTRPPTRVLSCSRHTQESSYRHGDELQLHGDASEPGSIPEERMPHPAGSASAVPSSLPDRSLGPCAGPREGRPSAGSHAQAEWAPESSPGMPRPRPPGSHFTPSGARPRAPAQRHTHGDAVITSPAAALAPAPPAMQKPATRGPAVTRRLRLPQGGLVSPS